MNEFQCLRQEGFGVADIASRLSVSRATVYRRLAEREEGEDFEPGPVESAMGVLIAGRELTEDGAVLAAEAVVLARKIDQLARSESSSAGLALASISRRLAECRLQLEEQPRDALTLLQERRERRLGKSFGTRRYRHGQAV